MTLSSVQNGGYDAGGFEALRAKTDNPRTHLFLILQNQYITISETAFSANRIDFEDMINDAHFYSEIAPAIELPYKYIIIDEF